MNKNRHFKTGIAGLLGLASGAFAIEPPGAAAPIPPQPAPEEAAAPPVEMPQAGAVEVPAPAVHGYMGVGASRLPELLGEHLKLPEGEGVVVRSLDPDGPAAKAGLAQNDIITRVSGKAVGSHDELREAVAGMKPGDEVSLDYLHRGDAKTATFALGTMPPRPAAIAGMEPKPLENLMMNGVPPDQMQRIREAIEQNMKAFEDLDAGGGMPEEGLLMGEGVHKRMQQMLQGLELRNLPGADLPGIGGFEMKGTSSSSIRMMDENGSVELKSRDGNKEVRVFGKDGKLQWEGPYDTPQDKEAVPADIRARIDRLNIDTDFKGNGLRLRMAPRAVR